MAFRDQVIAQRDNFENALVAGGMPRAAAKVFADELTEFVAMRRIARLKRAEIEANISKRLDMRNGKITRAQYEALTAGAQTEIGTMFPDGTIEFMD